jgi:uncharacterized repeat protein (TIGR03803 family)
MHTRLGNSTFRNYLAAQFVVWLTLAVSTLCWGSDTVLYSFDGPTGAMPYGGLTSDSAGNLYGTTKFGGASQICAGGCGVVFQLAVNAAGGYTESVLYNFQGSDDGGLPTGTLIRDAAGNLFGTATCGGLANCPGGNGVVWELSANNTYMVLYRFKGGRDGSIPEAGVAMDTDGNLYGTTLFGGRGTCAGTGCGIVFRLTKSSQYLREAVLHRFTGGSDGGVPFASLLADSAAQALYGTTEHGGTGSCMDQNGNGCGVVFRLSASGFRVLHTFRGTTDGGEPFAPVIQDTSGNLYGTASIGGTGGQGIVFELQPSGTNYKEVALHNFMVLDGAQPIAGLAFDPAETELYGTTFMGGVFNFGVAYQVEIADQFYTDLNDFSDGGADGAFPFAGLLIPNGNPKLPPPIRGSCPPTCLGVTTGGGKATLGTVFQVSQ